LGRRRERHRCAPAHPETPQTTAAADPSARNGHAVPTERLLPNSVEVRLMLDRCARFERDRRRRGGEGRMVDYGR